MQSDGTHSSKGFCLLQSEEERFAKQVGASVCCFRVFPGGNCVTYKVMCISILLDDLEGINYDCSWWSVVWVFAHMLVFFLSHFPWREFQSLAGLFCCVMLYFSMSVIILDMTCLTYLRFCLVSSHPQFWERGEVIHKK